MIGTDIHKARKDKGWTQHQLADISGVHYVSISRIESGITIPQAATCRKLSNALGVIFIAPTAPRRKPNVERDELMAQIKLLNSVERSRVQGYIDALIEERSE